MQSHIDITRVREDFDRVAAVYERHATLQRDVAQELCRRAREYGSPEGTYLDLGSGTGYVMQKIKSQKPEARTLQLDIAFNMCRASMRWAQSINANMESLPLASDTMACIYSSLALQWSNHPEKVFAESYRVLKRGGVCAMATFGPNSLHELRVLFGNINMFLPAYQLEASFRDAGFGNIAVDTVAYTRYYDSAQELLRSIKRVGARSKYVGYMPHFPGKQSFLQLDVAYRSRFGTSHEIPATWEVVYLMGRK